MIASCELVKRERNPSAAPRERATRPLGVSLVVCTHNGEFRLPDTLTRIAAQQVPSSIPWEVVVVDSGSTDRTAAVAGTCWPSQPPAPLRVVTESQPGLSLARLRGLAVSSYEYVSFLDDDNWPAPDWVETAFTLMNREPGVGAAGSRNEPEIDGEPPEWFDEFGALYAVGEQGSGGDVTDTRGLLWGAGLTVRHEAWLELQRSGFAFHSTDRVGSALTSGGDSELCLGLRVCGWRLWYEPALRLRHVMAPERMTWARLLGTVRASGQATVHHDAFYLRLMPERRADYWCRIRWSWPWQAGAAALAAARAAACEVRAADGVQRRAAQVAKSAALGRVEGLLRNRASYMRSVRSALAAAAPPDRVAGVA